MLTYSVPPVTYTCRSLAEVQPIILQSKEFSTEVKQVKAVFVAPKLCCRLLGFSSLAAGMAHKPDEDLIQPVAWA